MPGYMAAQNLLRLSAKVPASFDRLEVMHPDEARNFLKAPAEKVAEQVKGGHMDLEAFIEVVMVFSMVMVCADREQQRIAREEEVQRRVEAITQQQKEVEKTDGDSTVPL